jgi:bifunctional non-homologous end joining protein LigD
METKQTLKPMLALAGDGSLPSGDWTFEIKWDGYRCVATIEDGNVTLTSRSGKPLKFNRIQDALCGLPDCIIDGEVVVLDKDGASDFGSLSPLSTEVTFMAFDLVDAPWRSRPIEQRREALELLLSLADSAVAVPSPVFTDGEALLTYVKENDLEGIVAKRNGSTYQVGRRSPDWIKVKVRSEQEFAVVGYTPQKDHGDVLGSLILAVNEGGRFVYAGKVGTGWDQKLGREILAELKSLNPSDLRVDVKDKDAVWVEATMVVQVAFQRWTKDGVIFHPSYQGKRIDKDACDVVREAA